MQGRNAEVTHPAIQFASRLFLQYRGSRVALDYGKGTPFSILREINYGAYVRVLPLCVHGLYSGHVPMYLSSNARLLKFEFKFQVLGFM
jgi:hypothetical protein